jgi:hypothetical protein
MSRLGLTSGRKKYTNIPYTTQLKMNKNQNLYPHFSNAVGAAPRRMVDANHCPDMEKLMPNERIIIGKISAGYKYIVASRHRE